MRISHTNMTENSYIRHNVHSFLTIAQQFERGDSQVGVVQYSHGNTQELVAMGDPRFDNIGALKE